MGEVLEFPSTRTCFACRHYEWNAFGNGRCQLFDEPIDSEQYAARHCSSYEPE